MYCDVCKENETTTQRKAACGCLIYTCDECMQDNAHMHAMHDKCVVCKGGRSINDMMLDEGSYMRNLMRDLVDIRDEEYRERREQDMLATLSDDEEYYSETFGSQTNEFDHNWRSRESAFSTLDDGGLFDYDY